MWQRHVRSRPWRFVVASNQHHNEFKCLLDFKVWVEDNLPEGLRVGAVCEGVLPVTEFVLFPTVRTPDALRLTPACN